MRTFRTFTPLLFITSAGLFLSASMILSQPVLAAPAAKRPAALPLKHPVKAKPASIVPATTLEVTSTGGKVDLLQFLMPERPTVFVFYKPSSTLEVSFMTELQGEIQHALGFSVIQLKTGSEPVAQQYQIQETPTALVYDRRGRLVGRSSKAEEIRTLVRQAFGVMRIDWAAEGDPRLDQVRQMLGGQRQIPGILRTMSLRPDYLEGFMAMSMQAQFRDGFLDRRTKELIGTYASALNQCKYCLGSHAHNLELQGEKAQNVDAIATLQLKAATLSAKDRALLAYVKVLTEEPSHVRDFNVVRLRQAGWTDEQIFEASYITSLFAFANRMADAYGLTYPITGWLPPSLRSALRNASGPSSPQATTNTPPAGGPDKTETGAETKADPKSEAEPKAEPEPKANDALPTPSSGVSHAQP